MSPQRAIPGSIYRGGTSKGLLVKAGDLPEEATRRDQVLLAAMGSPDVREIDGVGGGHPLTSKVAVVRTSSRPDADVDYLFLQVWPDRAEVSDSQNCGNMLAAVGPFALDEGLVASTGEVTEVRIWMENTSSLAVARVQTPAGHVEYEGAAHIDGVPGTHAPIPIEFVDVAGSSCGRLLPTGSVVDTIDGVRVTCVDNGMPVVCLAARDFGLSGEESPSVPKMSLLSPGRHGGAVMTRTFIPHRVHEAIGVFGALSVATACLLPGSVAQEVATLSARTGDVTLDIEHPNGYFSVTLEVEPDGDTIAVRRSALLRTARLLMRGHVMV